MALLKIDMMAQAETEELRAFYAKCVLFWEGACNAGAGLRFIVHDAACLGLDLNTDPGVRLVLGHIAYLMALDGLGGCREYLRLDEHVRALGNIGAIRNNEVKS